MNSLPPRRMPDGGGGTSAMTTTSLFTPIGSTANEAWHCRFCLRPNVEPARRHRVPVPGTSLPELL